jgi:sugar transferase EpsL
MDIVAGSIALVALSPLALVIAFFVRINLGRPILFRQYRPGLKGKLFPLIKFRTMTCACAISGEPLSDAHRLTKFGQFLRSTSLDELPGLLNVIRGEMSLVGPRPLLTEYLELYTPEQKRRHEVKPGITGWAQINGRNALDWDQKFALDLWYVDNQTLGLDIDIILRTMWRVVKREGIARPGHATMPEFVGSARPADDAGSGEIKVAYLHENDEQGRR